MNEGIVPVPTPETRPFWEAASRGELSTKMCSACGKLHFYPRMVCPFCGSTALRWVTLSGRGRLYSFIVNHRPIPKRDGVEIIAIVELEEGPRMMTNIVDAPTDPHLLPLDAPVEVSFTMRQGVALPVFRLSEAGEG